MWYVTEESVLGLRVRMSYASGHGFLVVLLRMGMGIKTAIVGIMVTKMLKSDLITRA